ncbi:MAG TPA: NifU family protein [Streptosporangiaceae bacterium]|nr:NifU family protein [Streptosporangiaceae bacterium]
MAEEQPGPARQRLGDRAVAAGLARIDELLGRLEQIPGTTAETALEAVAMLADVYGEALARVMEYASGDAAITGAIADDELVGHLLVLHGIHPEPVEQRVSRALAEIRPYLHGGDAGLESISGGVARVRVPGGCGCPSSPQALAAAVRDAVLAAAPELSGVEPVTGAAGRAAAFVPVESLLRGAGASGQGHTVTPGGAA